MSSSSNLTATTRTKPRTPLPNWPLRDFIQETPARPEPTKEDIAFAPKDLSTFKATKYHSPFFTTVPVFVAMTRWDFEEYAKWKFGPTTRAKLEGLFATHLFEREEWQRKGVYTYRKRLGFEWSHKWTRGGDVMVLMHAGEEKQWFAVSRGVEEDKRVEEWRVKKVREHNEMVAAKRAAAAAAAAEKEEGMNGGSGGGGVAGGFGLEFDGEDLYDA